MHTQAVILNIFELEETWDGQDPDSSGQSFFVYIQ